VNACMDRCAAAVLKPDTGVVDSLTVVVCRRVV
jgi:hypothetical protein